MTDAQAKTLRMDAPRRLSYVRFHNIGFNSANDLKLLRRQAGLTQAQLGERSGHTASSVKYWERQSGRLDGYAPRAFREYLQSIGTTVPSPRQPPVKPAAPQPLPKQCGAQTRKGAPCQCKPEPGKRRCKFHGGRSTGPRTQEGRDRIAAAQRRRWHPAGSASIPMGSIISGN
jgi:DNA-binding transcriptional regulator YiaG